MSFTSIQKRFLLIRFHRAQAANDFVEIVADGHDLTIGNADKLAGIGRSRIGARFFVDLACQLAILVLDACESGHDSFTPRPVLRRTWLPAS